MAHTTPRVAGATLVARADNARAIAVGTPAWYAWLEEASTFAFVGVAGSFTARKEQSGQTGWYWKAYRKHHGRLHRAYLGKSADLTLDRLHTIAGELAGRVTTPPTVEIVGVRDPAPAAGEGASSLLPSAGLPTGTLTFLFTDIEGSSQLWE